jgi:hypothetical protein
LKSISRVKGQTHEVDEKDKSKPETGDDLSEELSSAIDAYIDKGITPKYRKINGFHPSNTNECPRYLVYLFRGVILPASHNARTQRIFDNGHAVHDRLYKYFRGMGILVKEEVPIRNPEHLPIPVEATADGIIEWNGQKVIELKSISDVGFMHRRLMKKPKDEHYRQIQIYMACLQIEEGYVIYENKNTQNILVLPVKHDKVFTDKLFKKYGKIYQAYKDGKLPKRYKSPTTGHCQYCAIRDKCWADKDEGVAI